MSWRCDVGKLEGGTTERYRARLDDKEFLILRSLTRFFVASTFLIRISLLLLVEMNRSVIMHHSQTSTVDLHALSLRYWGAAAKERERVASSKDFIIIFG